MKLLPIALLAALCPLPALAHDHFTSSRDARPPFSDATYYNGQYYSTACRDWDDDGDGVSNCHDHCPDTAQGVDVGYRGCPVPGALTLAPAHFAFNSARISPAAAVELNDAILALAEFPTLPVHVVGHTDSIGSEAYNQRLSERRAEAIRRYLSERGIASERLHAHGQGEGQPVADNTTAEGRAQNRRGEFVFDGNSANHHHDGQPCGCQHPPHAAAEQPDNPEKPLYPVESFIL